MSATVTCSNVCKPIPYTILPLDNIRSHNIKVHIIVNKPFWRSSFSLWSLIVVSWFRLLGRVIIILFYVLNWSGNIWTFNDYNCIISFWRVALLFLWIHSVIIRRVRFSVVMKPFLLIVVEYSSLDANFLTSFVLYPVHNFSKSFDYPPRSCPRSV